MWVMFLAAARGSTPGADSVEAPSAGNTTAPIVHVQWRKNKSQILFLAPEGKKISWDAPGRLAIRWGENSSESSWQGAQFPEGFALGELRGAALQGTLEVALCDLAATTCQPSAWAISGNVPTAKKGDVALLVGPLVAEHEPSFGPNASASSADAAFAEAKAKGKLVMLDFSAIWCPPCNMLADEVLHRDLPELEGFSLAVLDADHPSSFLLKDRYAIGGYPTVVVVDADGNERSRTVGYEGKEAFLTWLASTPQATDGVDFAKPPEQVTPARAATLAKMRVDQHDYKSAEIWLARALQGDEAVLSQSLDLHLARFTLKKEPADLEWLLQHGGESATRFAGTAAEMLETNHSEADIANAHRAIALALRQAKGVELADMLSAAASIAELNADPDTAHAYHAAAVSVIRSAMNGVPEHDKGYVDWLAAELEQSDDPEAAIAVLTDAVSTWPNEPTFYLSLAPLLGRLKRTDEALAAAERAIALAWDDNRLRAVANKAELLVSVGRADEAKAIAAAQLAATPAPAVDLSVRTHRYRERLQAYVTPKPALAQ